MVVIVPAVGPANGHVLIVWNCLRGYFETAATSALRDHNLRRTQLEN